MKKNKLFVLLTSLLLSSCTIGGISNPEISENNEPTSVESVSSSESEQISPSITGKLDLPYEEKELSALIDYCSNLKLDTTKGRKYMEVTTKSLIDGDTSHFYIPNDKKAEFPADSTTASDGILKVRYLGIDTPESTGAVEEWGKSASNFNKERLKNATSIIVESNDDKWNADSTGTRFLCFVWYKTAEMTEYKNLNLEILQEGFSFAKSLQQLCYAESFQKAYSQALEHELHVFAKKASMWKFDASNNALTESNGLVVGSSSKNQSLVSFEAKNLADINALCVYNARGTVQTATAIASNMEKDPTYYLAIKIDGKLYYATKDIVKGLGSVTDDINKALQVHIENESSKKGYYNIYYLDENEEKTYFTINSSKNIDFMHRDPNFYYGAYLQTTVKGLRTNPADYVGKLVRFEGVVTYSKDKTYYIQTFDEETELYYGLQVYVGFNFSAGEALLAIGNEVSICGTFSYYETGGTYQVSGLTYMAMKPTYEKNTRVISMGNDIVIRPITVNDLLKTTVDEQDLYDGISYTETLMNTMVSLNDLEVTKVYTTGEQSSSAGAMTLTCKDSEGKVCTIRTEVIYKEGTTLATKEDFIGKHISVTRGMVDSFNGEYQVRVFSYNDFSFND